MERVQSQSIKTLGGLEPRAARGLARREKVLRRSCSSMTSDQGISLVIVVKNTTFPLLHIRRRHAQDA